MSGKAISFTVFLSPVSCEGLVCAGFWQRKPLPLIVGDNLSAEGCRCGAEGHWDISDHH